MSYLFDSEIEPATRVESSKVNATHLKSVSQTKSDALFQSHRRINNIHDDYDVAKALVATMGAKVKQTGQAHAQDYVDNWRQVSDNCGQVSGIVSGELHHAYQLGLDIRSEAVIGAMFYLAVQVWSQLGEYSSPTQVIRQ